MSPESNSPGGGTLREKLISALVSGPWKAHQDQAALFYVLSVCWRAPASMLLHHLSSQGLLQLRVPLPGSVNPYRGHVS